MNSKERIEAVIALEQPDRVPVGPMLDYFAATYTGCTHAELMFNGKKRIKAVLKTMHDLGPWDLAFLAEAANANMTKLGLPMKSGLPDGAEHDLLQYYEREILTADDYELLEQIGVSRFMRQMPGRIDPKLKGVRLLWTAISSLFELRQHIKTIATKTTAEVAFGGLSGPLYDHFSFGRGLTAMSIDTFKYRDRIISAARVWAKGSAQFALRMTKFTGIPRVFVGLARSSPEFISRTNFETLVLPDIEYIVNTIVDAGLTPLFHCDTNWTKFLDLFRRFPARRCILELDGTTDIFKAKEILGDHMCIMGDVPATLLARGTKDEVLAYCKRLIHEVGKGGGFILSSGCSIPANAKVENVRAFTESVEEWGRY